MYFTLQDQRKIDLYIDGGWKGEIDGIPKLSDSTKLVFHVWNQDNYVPVLDDEFLPPTTLATFRALRYENQLIKKDRVSSAKVTWCIQKR